MSTTALHRSEYFARTASTFIEWTVFTHSDQRPQILQIASQMSAQQVQAPDEPRRQTTRHVARRPWQTGWLTILVAAADLALLIHGAMADAVQSSTSSSGAVLQRVRVDNVRAQRPLRRSGRYACTASIHSATSESGRCVCAASTLTEWTMCVHSVHSATSESGHFTHTTSTPTK